MSFRALISQARILRHSVFFLLGVLELVWIGTLLTKLVFRDDSLLNVDIIAGHVAGEKSSFSNRG